MVAYYALGNLILLATAVIGGATAVVSLIIWLRRRAGRRRARNAS
jgi:hypothetical protein